MTPLQQIEFVAMQSELMLVAHGMSAGTHSEADLLEMNAKIIRWIDRQIDRAITAAVAPFIKVDHTSGNKRERLK